MAIWQHTWLLVPITSDFDRRFSIFNEQTATEFLRKSSMFWKGTNTKFQAIANEIDFVLPRTDYSSASELYWKSHTDSLIDNDCYIYTEGEYIKEFQIRIDVRDQLNIRRLVTFVMSLCEKYNFTLINLNYHLVRPEIEDITNDVLQSNAMSFLQDPIVFLDKLNTSE